MLCFFMGGNYNVTFLMCQIQKDIANRGSGYQLVTLNGKHSWFMIDGKNNKNHSFREVNNGLFHETL